MIYREHLLHPSRTRATGIALAMLLLAWGKPVQADPLASKQNNPPPEECKAKKYKPIVGKGSTVCFPVNRTVLSKVHIPPGEVTNPPHQWFRSRWVRADDEVHVAVLGGAPVGTRTSFRVHGPQGFTEATVVLQVVSDKDPVLGDYHVKPLSEEQAKITAEAWTEAEAAKTEAQAAHTQARVAQAQVKEAQAKANSAEDRAQRAERKAAIAKALRIRSNRELKRASEQAERSLARAKAAEEKAKQAETAARTATKEAERARKEALQARAREKAALEEAAKAKREQRRRDAELFASDKVRTRYAKPETASIVGQRARADFVRSTWRNDTYFVALDVRAIRERPLQVSAAKARGPNREPLPTTIELPTDFEHYITIHKGETKRIVLAIDMPPNLDSEDLHLELFEQGIAKPVLAADIPREWRDGRILIPVSDKEVQRRRWAKQIILGPIASYGACWLATGVDGNNDLDPTDCTQIGAFVRKGFHENFALGATVLGAWTGDAEFDNVMIGDLQGDLTRSAKLLRMQVDAYARFSGERTVPFARIGVGLQGTSYESSFTSGDPPESDLDIAAIFTFGGGLQYRLGDHILAGVNVAYNLAAQDEHQLRSSLEAGIYVGVGWHRSSSPE